jgi:hypothetical protein
MSKKLVDFADVDLTTINDRAELGEAIEDGYATLAPLLDLEPADLTAEQAEEVTNTFARIKELEARDGELATVEAERVASLDEVRAAAQARREAAEAAEAGEETPAEEPQQPETDAAPVEVAPEAVEIAEPVAAAAEPAATAAPVAVAASARNRLSGARPAAPSAPKERPVAKPKVSLRASADAQSVQGGSELSSLKDVGMIAADRIKQMMLGGGNGQFTAGIATFSKPFSDDLVVKNGMDDEAMYEVVQHAGDTKRLEQGLTAAGWCAPSETIYDLCEGGTTEGLLDVPETSIQRGGVRHTQGPDFSALYTGGFDLTEAQVIAGTEKTCVEIPCPTFADVRLDAVGICVTSPLLLRQGYPELESAFLSEAMIAHQHRVSTKVLSKIVTAAGTALAAGNLGSIAGGALTTVELVAEGQRATYRWSMNEQLEVVAPHWFRTALRADYAMRNGVDLQAVSDETIASYFAARNLRIQYVYGWQALPANAVEFPATVQLLVYRAGTFVKGTAPVISLSAVYDSTLLKVNKHIALFFEEGVLVLQRCYGAKLITVPVCVAGRTGAADVVECLTAGA